MLYSLFLVIYLAGGNQVDVELKRNITDDTCIDLRDFVRSEVDYTNDLEMPFIDGQKVEFVEAECRSQKLII